ncbi:DUF362 domain-containing protein [Acidobacteriota bacterium]
MPCRVYFIPASLDNSDEELARKTEKIFFKLGLDKKIEPKSFLALKIHFGEKKSTGYIKPPWLMNMISQIRKRTSRVFLTDTNTLYLGNRANSIEHLRLAWEHGFSFETLGAPVLIADGLIGRENEEIPVNLPRIKTAKVASAFLNTDILICLSHFTGHILTGFGAAIKNLGMGCSSRAGKLEQHSDVHPRVNPKLCTNCSICLDYCPTEALVQENGSAFIIEEKCIGCGECLVVCNVGAVKMCWDEDYARVQEKMTEYAYSILKIFEGKIGFINFLLKVTKNCDCMAKDEPAIVEDIGILGSIDPVAVDKASVDLINDRSGIDLIRETNDVNWAVQLYYGEKIGLGTTDYKLVEIEP